MWLYGAHFEAENTRSFFDNGHLIKAASSRTRVGERRNEPRSLVQVADSGGCRTERDLNFLQHYGLSLPRFIDSLESSTFAIWGNPRRMLVWISCMLAVTSPTDRSVGVRPRISGRFFFQYVVCRKRLFGCHDLLKYFDQNSIHNEQAR